MSFFGLGPKKVMHYKPACSKNRKVGGQWWSRRWKSRGRQGGMLGTRWGREGAMISTPTPPWPRPFHLWARPQLDFLRITRIRKSYGMVFLHQNIWMHTWKRILFLCISRPLPDYLSFDLCYFLREPSKQWIIKQDNIIVSIPLPIVRVGGGEKAGWDWILDRSTWWWFFGRAD